MRLNFVLRKKKFDVKSCNYYHLLVLEYHCSAYNVVYRFHRRRIVGSMLSSVPIIYSLRACKLFFHVLIVLRPLRSRDEAFPLIMCPVGPHMWPHSEVGLARQWRC